jgi:hypothetical protein
VLGLDQEKLVAITTSFVWQPAYELKDPGEFRDRPEAYDTAGAFAAELEQRGLRWETLSPRERSWFIHYGGRSWDASARSVQSATLQFHLWRNRRRIGRGDG